MHVALLIYFLLFFAIAIVLPTWRIWKRDRINALVLPRDDSAHGVIGRWFKRLIAGLFAMIVSLAAGANPAWFGELQWANHELARSVGMVFLVLAFLIIVLAQAQMGRSWRIGVDRNAKPELVTTGLFARSRNPIFLGMRVSILGLFLIVPSGLSLAFFLLSEALLAVQVRLEEDYLQESLGQVYTDYSSRVRRWV